MNNFKYESQTDRIVRELLEDNNDKLGEFAQSVYDLCKHCYSKKDISKFVLICNPLSMKFIKKELSLDDKLDYVRQIGDITLNYYSYNTKLKDIDINVLFTTLIPKGKLKLLPLIDNVNNHITPYPIFIKEE